MSALDSDQLLVLMAVMGGIMGFIGQRIFGLLSRTAVLEAKVEVWASEIKEANAALKQVCRELHDLRVLVASRLGKGYNGPAGGGA